MSVGWNLWHGCRKYSPGCQNCYVYRGDERYGRDPAVVRKTGDFDLPIRKDRHGAYKIPPGTLVYTCFTSDFFLEDADGWRGEAWRMIKRREDLSFFLITKRILRFPACVPDDWGDGYPNVSIACTVEDQQRADERLPVYRAAAIRTKAVICEPLLGPIDLSDWLGSWVSQVVAGGESGELARPCDYRWILSLRDQCRKAGVPFRFKQTGARLIKDGRLYRIPRAQQHRQAKKAGIDWDPLDPRYGKRTAL